MNKKTKAVRKRMFLMKETLVALTPDRLGRVHGATDCTTVTNWQLSNGGTCNACTNLCVPDTTTQFPDPNDKYRLPTYNC